MRKLLACALALTITACVPEPPPTENVSFAAPAQPAPLRVGVAAISISPTEPDFLAGGLPYRRWLRVHDEIWARAIVLDDGGHRVALISLDLIGLYHDDVQRARAAIQERSPVDYALIAATHTHNGPDTLGAWAPQLGGFIGGYRAALPEKIAAAVQCAAADLRPVRIRYSHGPVVAPRLSKDTRPPEVVDDTLTVWQARAVADDAVVATVVHFAAHPITIPSVNFDISSDFVHYLRQYIEQGGEGDDGPISPAGGVCVFFNGALGGRITPATSGPLKRNRTRDLGYDRAQGYGYRLAARSLLALAQGGVELPPALGLGVRSRGVDVELENPLLRFGTRFGTLDRFARSGFVRSEVAIVDVGPLSFIAVPGMPFPESVTGAAAPLSGSDFPDAVAERPALRDLTPGQRVIVVGLANDMLGYLIPRPVWDERPPYTHKKDEPPYGEFISPGPSAMGTVTAAFGELISKDLRR